MEYEAHMAQYRRAHGIKPQLTKINDYKVRVLPGSPGTGAKVRVLIESTDGHDHWGTVGVSHDIIEASWQALVDSYNYKMYKAEKNNSAENQGEGKKTR